MRLILGLDRPSAGWATVNGRAYRAFEAPLHEVGALLEARAIHTGRSAYNHPLAQAQTHAIGRDRVDEVIRLVGLESVARKRVGGFSLGMGQRLGIAAALLGDPATLILDEPSNGLDPEGIRWIRNLLKQLAAEGRTVFVSSHLMSEIALTAERLVVIGRGRLIADTSVEDFVRSVSGDAAVRVRCADPGRLAELLAAQGGAGVLVRVHRDEAAGRVLCGLDGGPEQPRWARLWLRAGQRRAGRPDRGLRRLPGEQPDRRGYRWIVCSTRSRTRPLSSMNW